MPILGIESSCDDLSMAIVESGALLAQLTASQAADHAPFGGVVPEIAARRHLEHLELTLEATLRQAGLKLEDLGGIVATYAPGLIGSLLVGLNFAKALAFGLRRPFQGVHHLEAHLWSAGLEQPLRLPSLGLIVSGGHSHLYAVEELGHYRVLGQSVDDAAGEAFDKFAKMIGLGYPGGPLVEELARNGDPEAFAFPVPRVKKFPEHTSFSGLKTLAADYWTKHVSPSSEDGLRNSDSDFERLRADLAASFQQAIVRALCAFAEGGLRRFPEAEQLWLVGGVACNQSLRRALAELSEGFGKTLCFPSPRFCTDNGAMVAALGERYLALGRQSPLSLNAVARLPLDRVC